MLRERKPRGRAGRAIDGWQEREIRGLRNRLCTLIGGSFRAGQTEPTPRAGPGGLDQACAAKPPAARRNRCARVAQPARGHDRSADPVTVTDPLNRFRHGAREEHFRLFEDKIEQKVTHFSTRSACVGRRRVRYQRQHGPKLLKSRQAVAPVDEDKPTRRRVLPGPVQRPAGTDGRFHARIRGNPEPADLRQSKGERRCWTACIWPSTR